MLRDTADTIVHLGQNLGNVGTGGAWENAAVDFLGMTDRNTHTFPVQRQGSAQATGTRPVVCPRPYFLPASSSWPNSAVAKSALKDEKCL